MRKELKKYAVVTPNSLSYGHIS